MSPPEEPPRLLGIGQFALRTRLPVSTLRYYDRIGLLVPAVVEPHSGYRRYRLEQLPAALRIAELRAVGVVPGDMAGILAGGRRASATLNALRRSIRREIAGGQRRLRHVESLLAGDPGPAYVVYWVDRAPQHVAVLPFSAPFPTLQAHVTRQIVRLRGAMRRVGLQRTGAWGAEFPAELPETVSGFVFAPVDGSASGVSARVLPRSRAVRVDHDGALALLPRAYQAGYAALDEVDARPGSTVLEQYPGLDTPERSHRVCLWISYSAAAG